jgi:hypothetical protein
MVAGSCLAAVHPKPMKALMNFNLICGAAALLATLPVMPTAHAQSNCPPTITNEPLSQTRLSGGGVTFSVGVSGTGPFTCQWLKNGWLLPNNMTPQGPTLTLDSVTSTNAGDYQVIVSSPWGSTISTVAALTVNYVPAITTQPESQYVVVGGVATFQVTATGTAPLTYHWLCNGTNLPTGANVPASTNASLTLSQVTAHNAGFYDVIITNAWGSVTRRMVALTLPPPPVITAQPVNLLGTNLQTVTFSVGVTSPGPLSYQWLHDGNPLPTSVITTVAGTGTIGDSGDGGPATNAMFNNPIGVTVDTGGNLFIADPYNQRIRQVDPNGLITTVAGNDPCLGRYEDDQVATNTTLLWPSGVALNADGTLFIADYPDFPEILKKPNKSAYV